MNTIFVHGGPGLNTRPESQLFTPYMGDSVFHFWNEPSALRKDEFKPDVAYSSCLESLKKFILQHSTQSPVTVVAHSFGSFLINDLLPQLGDRVAQLILLCPVFDLSQLDQNIADLGLRTLAQKGDEEARKKYQALQLNMPKVFDERRFTVLVEALSMPEVLPAYWHNHERAAAYNSYLMKEGWQINFASFKAVRETALKDRVENSFQGPTLIFYGRHDPVSRLVQDQTYLRTFHPRAEIRTMESSGHYPHIEETGEFFKVAHNFSRHSS